MENKFGYNFHKAWAYQNFLKKIEALPDYNKQDFERCGLDPDKIFNSVYHLQVTEEQKTKIAYIRFTQNVLKPAFAALFGAVSLVAVGLALFSAVMFGMLFWIMGSKFLCILTFLGVALLIWKITVRR